MSRGVFVVILTDELKNRLKLAMAKMNMRPIELSELTHIPKSSISQYMSGYSKPNSERVYLISKALNVSEAWLMGFDVPEKREKTPYSDEHIYGFLTSEQFELLQNFNELTDNQKQEVIEFIQFKKAQNKQD